MAGALLAPMRVMAWKLPTEPDRERVQSAGFLLRARGSEPPRLPAGERGRPLLTGLLPQAWGTSAAPCLAATGVGASSGWAWAGGGAAAGSALTEGMGVSDAAATDCSLAEGPGAGAAAGTAGRGKVPAPSGMGPAMARQQTVRSPRAQALAMPRQGTVRLLRAQASAMPERLMALQPTACLLQAQALARRAPGQPGRAPAL